MSQLSIWEILEIALLSRDRRGMEGEESLPVEQEGEIWEETKREKWGREQGGERTMHRKLYNLSSTVNMPTNKQTASGSQKHHLLFLLHQNI